MTPSQLDLESAARRWFGKASQLLTDNERNVLHHLLRREPIAEDAPQPLEQDGQLTFGERLADHVASFGGSWTFILLFALGLVVWTLINSLVLKHPFDPYPYIFLNLLLSMLAAIQAPVIMMSQNRQAAKDRTQADSDYQVNLKAEMEIMALHDKLDAFRVNEIEHQLRQQTEQITALYVLLENRPRGHP